MYQRFLKFGERVFLRAEGLADTIFTPRYNPFYFLGAIAIFFLWLVAISGVYLFIFYKIATPYESVKYITEGQWYLGGIMRGIHRYAAGGLIFTSILHLLHVYFKDRYRHWRWIAWVSGIALLMAVWITGIIGYWMVWDERSQMIAQLTTEFLDYLPIFGGSLSLSFTQDQLVTGLFFFIALFLHLFIPVFLFILLWIHVMRISKPVINPPREMAVAIGGVILVLSIIRPVTLLLPADTKKIISITGMDWFYLFFFPMLNAIPVWTSWLLLGAGLAVLTSVPWLIRLKRPPAADILIEKCTGCAQCFKDCPYDAIHIRPRTDDKPYELEAIVMPARCAGCGICVGSCSFDGVILPGRTVVDVMLEIKRLLGDARESEKPLLLGMGCAYSVRLNRELKGLENVKFITLPCIGMIHPSWIEYSLNSGAEGVFIYGCQMGDCQYRFGNQWIEERLSSERAPILKRAVDRERIRVYWLSALQSDRLLEEIKRFQDELRYGGRSEARGRKSGVRRKARFAFASIAIFILAAPILYLSNAPYTFSSSDNSMLKLSVRHTAERIVECDEAGLIQKEAERYRELLKKTDRARMQLGKLGECGRERHPVYVELYIDNQKRLGKDYMPGGVKRDGPSFAYEQFTVMPGLHRILVRMRDSRDGDHFDYSREEDIEFKAGHIRIIDFDETKKGLRVS